MMLRRLGAETLAGWPRFFGRRRGFGDAAAQPVFRPSVEAWRSWFEQYAGDLPINFLLAWLDRESGGNACDFTSLHESGIFQLMPPSFGSQDTVIAGTSEDELRTACVPGTSQQARELTDDEKKIQVVSGVRFVNALRDHAHQLLDAVGADWPETSPDFWSLVKQLHTLPSLTAYLQVATQQLGHPPSGWADFISVIPPFDPAGRDTAHWLGLSSDVGQYGAGGGRPLGGRGMMIGVAIVGFAIGALIWHTSPHRSIAHR